MGEGGGRATIFLGGEGEKRESTSWPCFGDTTVCSKAKDGVYYNRFLLYYTTTVEIARELAREDTKEGLTPYLIHPFNWQNSAPGGNMKKREKRKNRRKEREKEKRKREKRRERGEKIKREETE